MIQQHAGELTGLTEHMVPALELTDCTERFENACDEFGMPLFRGPNIGKLKAAHDVRALIEALGHDRSTVRAEAASALGEIGDSRALSPLAVLLSPESDRDEETRTAARDAACRIGTAEELIKILNEGPAEARSGAAVSLGLLGDREAVEPLIAVLAIQANPALRVAAAGALGELGDPQAAGPVVAFFIDRLRSFDLRGHAPSPSLLDHLVNKLWAVPIGQGLLDAMSFKLAMGMGWLQLFAVETGALVRLGPAAVEQLEAALRGEDHEFVRLGIESALRRIEREAGIVASVNLMVADEETARRLTVDFDFMIATLETRDTPESRAFLAAVSDAPVGSVSGSIFPAPYGKVLVTLNLEPAKTVTYLYLLFTKAHLPLLSGGGSRRQEALDEVASVYRARFGPDVEMLGAQVVDDELPTDPDAYVVSTCLMAMKQNGVSFDSARDEISYSVDQLDGHDIGVCKMVVHSDTRLAK